MEGARNEERREEGRKDVRADVQMEHDTKDVPSNVTDVSGRDGL